MKQFVYKWCCLSMTHSLQIPSRKLSLRHTLKKRTRRCWVLFTIDVLSTYNHEVQPLVWLKRISFRIISRTYKLNGFVLRYLLINYWQIVTCLMTAWWNEFAIYDLHNDINWSWLSCLQNNANHSLLMRDRHIDMWNKVFQPNFPAFSPLIVTLH